MFAKGTRHRHAITSAGLAVALSALLVNSAAAHSFDQPDRVLVSTTGNNSELVQRVGIGSAPGQGQTVVMSLTAGGQPLRSGDGLNPSSELQVTTDCTVQQDSCVGTPYSYNPVFDTRLVLTSSSDPTGSGPGARVLAEQTGLTCTHEQHHCIVVFPFAASPFAVPSPALPCTFEAAGCQLNVVLDAYTSDPGHDQGDVLIVGENEPGCCGITKQDKGRVNALRLRPVVAGQEPVGQVSTASTSNRLVSGVPIRDTVSEGETVVFSQRLDKLKKHEQLAVSANLTTDISSLRYNRVLINSRVILADSRRATNPASAVKAVEQLKGEISEANGSNCTQRQALPVENTNPCQTRKSGVAHLIQNASDPLYVNVVVSATPARSGRAQPGETAAITGGALKVVRYPANRYG